MLFFKSFVALTTVALAAVAVSGQNNNTDGNNTIYDILKSNGQTTQLFKLLNSSSYSNILSMFNNTNGSYTFFAPTDAAFTPAVLALLPSVNDIPDHVYYHTLNGTHHTSEFHNGPNIYDTLSSNSSLLKWSNGTGLPIDIDKNSTGITLFSGTSNASIVRADVTASNGVVHFIDTILDLPHSPSTTIKNVQNLTKFQQLLNQTGLLNTVDGDNGVTIFAPSDDAFDNFNASGYSNDTLTNILKYHIVNAVYYSTNITSLPGPTNVTAANNSNLTLSSSNSEIQVSNTTDNAKVTTSDILTNNGVVHVVDRVLMPPANSTNNGSSTTNAAPASAQVSFAAMLLTVVAVVSTIFL
jgi:uncharacterized surface protein with fasciclin (FAS1) repeats